MQLLKQDSSTLFETSQEIMLIFAVTQGYLDSVDDSDIEVWRQKFLEYLDSNCKKLLNNLEKEQKLKEELQKEMTRETESFMKVFNKLYAKRTNSEK